MKILRLFIARRQEFMFLLLLLVQPMGWSQSGTITFSAVTAPPGAPVLITATHTLPEQADNLLTTMVMHLTYPAVLFSSLEVVALPGLSLAGKTLDVEKTDAQISLAVFGEGAAVPAADLFYLLGRIHHEAPVGPTIFPSAVSVQGANAEAEPIAVAFSGGAISVIASASFHSADSSQDWRISMTELLRLVQFYHVGAYHCDPDAEDGFAPGLGDLSCGYHDADYAPADGRISFTELLRMIQLYNAPHAAYHNKAGTEDGYAVGPFGFEGK